MEQQQETFASKQYRVLRAIYDLRSSAPNGLVDTTEVLKKTNLAWTELNDILIDLEERKGLIDAYDSLVKINGAGMEQIEETSKHPNQGTKFFPAQVVYQYNNNSNTFNAPVGGVQQHSNNSSQTVTQNIAINPAFDSAVSSITDLIKTSSLSDFKKDDLLNDVKRIRELADLAAQKPSAEVVEAGKKKIDYFGAAIKATELAIKVGPLLPDLAAHFENMLRSIHS